MSISSSLSQATSGSYGHSGNAPFALGDRGLGNRQSYSLPKAGIRTIEQLQDFPSGPISPEMVEEHALQAGASKANANLCKFLTKYRKEIRQNAATVHIQALSDREHQLKTTEKVAVAHGKFQQAVTDARFNIALTANYTGGYQRPAAHARKLLF